jgi:hypothetical protein
VLAEISYSTVSSLGTFLFRQPPIATSTLQSIFIHGPREHEILVLSHPLNHPSDPLPVFFLAQAISPPSVHAVPNTRRIQLGPAPVPAFALLVKDVKQKSNIHVLEAQFRQTLQDACDTQEVVRSL